MRFDLWVAIQDLLTKLKGLGNKIIYIFHKQGKIITIWQVLIDTIAQSK